METASLIMRTSSPMMDRSGQTMIKTEQEIMPMRMMIMMVLAMRMRLKTVRIHQFLTQNLYQGIVMVTVLLMPQIRIGTTMESMIIKTPSLMILTSLEIMMVMVQEITRILMMIMTALVIVMSLPPVVIQKIHRVYLETGIMISFLMLQRLVQAVILLIQTPMVMGLSLIHI